MGQVNSLNLKLANQLGADNLDGNNFANFKINNKTGEMSFGVTEDVSVSGFGALVSLFSTWFTVCVCCYLALRRCRNKGYSKFQNKSNHYDSK